jgi:hypothetical protein
MTLEVLADVEAVARRGAEVIAGEARAAVKAPAATDRDSVTACVTSGASLRNLGGAPSDRICEGLHGTVQTKNRRDSGPPALAHGVPLALTPFEALL